MSAHPSDKIPNYFDDKWLQVAFDQAKKALDEGEVPVGCVFVNDGRVIASGRNAVNATKNATRHAEIECIEQIIKTESHCSTKPIDVYVNVEPCVMCACALSKIQSVRSVFFGCRNPRFGGCGTVLDVQKILQFGPSKFESRESIRGTENDSCNQGIHFSGDHRAEEAVNLLKEFYKGENPNAPEDKRKPSRP